ncbi:hypothetical protein MBLNU457_1709t2 [Dothideomycetes sp. NU457]
MPGISFLDLPAEIRTMIYSHIVPELFLYITSDMLDHADRWSEFASLISLRLCCSQINGEVLHQFFTTSAFAIHLNAEVNTDINVGQWKISRCDKEFIPILRYQSLRGFCIPHLFFDTMSYVKNTTSSEDVSRDWYICREGVSPEHNFVDFKHNITDEGYAAELRVEGQVLLEGLVNQFAAETEGPYRGLEAKHLERIIDSMNDLIERKLRAIYIKGIQGQGRRRSARIASRPRKWYCINHQ